MKPPFFPYHENHCVRTDRIRQEIALKELLVKQRATLTGHHPDHAMRKTFSVPNIRQLKVCEINKHKMVVWYIVLRYK